MAPTALPELQSRVMRALLGGEDAACAALLRHDGRPPGGLERLQVYRNNLFESLTAALGAVYPVLAKLVGAGFFRRIAREYIRAHPSRSGNLHDFGASFAAFLAQDASANALPYLSDVAALEWAWHEVYHAADAAPPELARLAEVPPEAQPRLRLVWQPALRLVASRFPLLAIWQANQDGADESAVVSLDAGGVNLLVARDDAGDFAIEIQPLAPAHYRWLEASLLRSATLAEATQAALALDPAFDLAGVLAQHAARGRLRGLLG
jgi:hypothetical protein